MVNRYRVGVEPNGFQLIAPPHSQASPVIRVEEAVTDLNPHRPGRAQLRHPVPHSD